MGLSVRRSAIWPAGTGSEPPEWPEDMSPEALRKAIIPLFRQLQALPGGYPLFRANAGQAYRSRPGYAALEAQIRLFAGRHWRTQGETISDTPPPGRGRQIKRRR